MPYKDLEQRRKHQREYYQLHKSEHKERNKKWIKSNNGKQYRWMYQYGIVFTGEEYAKLIILQENRCAICKRPRSDFKRDFAVDHNHNTGKVRYLLCSNCNSGLGKFMHSPELLKEAAKYLEVSELMENT